jgi:erythromycin esterase
MTRRALVSLLTFLLAASARAEIDPAAKIQAVKQRAVVVRATEPKDDDDFADLMPLARSIGGARVVQLGEATHGDGGTFLAKARLIRFLHQVMGFDAIAWESGFVDVRDSAAVLRGGGTAREAATRGLYGAWNVQEVARTLDYIRKSQETGRPIDLVGFDSRVAKPPVRAEGYPKMVFAFFDRLDPKILSGQDRQDFTTMSIGLVPAEYYQKPGLRAYNRELPKRLIAVIDARRPELRAWFGEREIDYMRQTLVSFVNMDRALGPGDKKVFGDGLTRDAAMAVNLLWWLNGPLAGRKVIVWAHNYHVMNDFTSEAKSREGEGRKITPMVDPFGAPTGWFLKSALGRELYTIGFTSFGGTFGDTEDGKPGVVVPGDLEKLLHETGAAALFLDLEHLPDDHWLREPITASFYFHEPMAARWARCYDAVLFLDEEKASTK